MTTQTFSIHRILVLVFTIIFSHSLLAQKTKWEITMGGSNSEYLFDMIPTADYGFLLCGSTLSSKGKDISTGRIGNYDGWLWKMKESGKKEWERRFAGDKDDYLKVVRHTNGDGGFILGLTSTSGKFGDKTTDLIGISDLWIIKLNAAGSIMWQKSFGGLGSEDIVRILPLSNGGYLLLANSTSAVSGNKTAAHYGGSDIWVIKIDSKGDILWQKSLGGEFDDKGVDIIQTTDKGFLIGGTSNSPNSGNKESANYGKDDYWVVKLDQLGEVQWERSYGGEDNDNLVQVQQFSPEQYYLYGVSSSSKSGTKKVELQNNSDYWFLVINSQGDIEKEYGYGYGQQNLLVSGFTDSRGEMVLGGTTQRKTKTGQVVGYLGTKLDTSATVVWEKFLNSKGSDYLSRIIETRDGDFVFAGTSNGAPNMTKKQQKGANDFWVVRVGNSNSQGGGASINEFTQGDSIYQQDERQSIEAIPNPVTTFTNIVIGFEYTVGLLQLYDAIGRVLYQKKITYQTEPLDLERFPPGVYVVKVQTNTQTASVNVVKVNN